MSIIDSSPKSGSLKRVALKANVPLTPVAELVVTPMFFNNGRIPVNSFPSDVMKSPLPAVALEKVNVVKLLESYLALLPSAK